MYKHHEIYLLLFLFCVWDGLSGLNKNALFAAWKGNATTNQNLYIKEWTEFCKKKQCFKDDIEFVQ